MFDIGFWELALIGVVALLVVGPERLPALARTLGLWLGRLRRFLSQVKEDVDRELRADELKRMLDKPKGLEDVYEVLDDTRNTVNKAARDLRKSADEPAAGKAGEAPPPKPEPKPEPAARSHEERPAEEKPSER